MAVFTKICGINWEHAGVLQAFAMQMLVVGFTDDIDPPDPDRDLPNIFIVEKQTRGDDNERLECWCQLSGPYSWPWLAWNVCIVSCNASAPVYCSSAVLSSIPGLLVST